MESEALEALEVSTVLGVIFERWGFDFRRYARPSITRQLRQLSSDAGCEHICDLVPRLLHEELFARKLVHGIYVSVSQFFRDPSFFAGLREIVLPELATRARPKIWHAGCASGEEAYSLAVLLEEAGLLERCRIYATDINLASLDVARRGVYPLAVLAEAEAAYRAAGGQRALREHYVALDEQPAHTWRSGPAGMFERRLRKAITWSAHDLTRDAVFSEIDLVLCRNTLFYFEKSLRAEILEQFRESLSPRGYLALGASESLESTAGHDAFEPSQPKLRIYRRRRAWTTPASPRS